MIGHLYRYPHPFDTSRFIYVGQGPKRDKNHRSGTSSFGRRFKNRFSDAELPQPTREIVEIQDQSELNELETIWMFRYHTWHGYSDGMNQTVPGSADYKSLGKIGGPAAGRKNIESGHMERMRNLPQTKTAQRLNGFRFVESGHLARMASMGGRKAVESGHLASITTPESRAKGGRAAVESGQLARARKSGIGMGGRATNESTNGRKGNGGRKGGQVTKEKGVGIFAMTPERRSEVSRRAGHVGGRTGAPIANHNRWHVARGISKPDTCSLCAKKKV